MRKIPKRSILLDRLHKGFVLSCVGITIFGTGYLGIGWYRYFAVMKPAAKQRQLLENQDLLREGSSEILEDSSPVLRS